MYGHPSEQEKNVFCFISYREKSGGGIKLKFGFKDNQKLDLLNFFCLLGKGRILFYWIKNE